MTSTTSMGDTKAQAVGNQPKGGASMGEGLVAEVIQSTAKAATQLNELVMNGNVTIKGLIDNFRKMTGPAMQAENAVTVAASAVSPAKPAGPEQVR